MNWTTGLNVKSLQNSAKYCGCQNDTTHFQLCFLVKHRPARVLQQREHANTCGLVVCHAKLIWLAGLNPGAKSNSVLQSPEWGSRWGSQDDLPSYFCIQPGANGLSKTLPENIIPHYDIIASMCVNFHLDCHWWLFSVKLIHLLWVDYWCYSCKRTLSISNTWRPARAVVW